MIYLVFLYGLVIGSFLNVLADRLPKGQDVLWGRSRCDFCKRNLRWYELIPVVSYIGLAGRCLRCHKRLSLQYPFIELVTAFGFVLMYLRGSDQIFVYLSSLVIFCSLLVIVVSDLKYQIIPDSMIVAGLIGTFFYVGMSVSRFAWPAHIASSAAAFMLFLLLWVCTRGRGMGLGDVKLSVILGLLTGFPGVVFSLYIAFLTGALVGVILILKGSKTLKSKIAFGPFMILGIAGSIIWYSNLFVLWKKFF